MTKSKNTAITNLCISLRDAGVTYELHDSNNEVVFTGGDIRGWFNGLTTVQMVWVSRHLVTKGSSNRGDIRRSIQWS